MRRNYIYNQYRGTIIVKIPVFVVHIIRLQKGCSLSSLSLEILIFVLLDYYDMHKSRSMVTILRSSPTRSVGVV